MNPAVKNVMRTCINVSRASVDEPVTRKNEAMRRKNAPQRAKNAHLIGWSAGFLIPDTAHYPIWKEIFRLYPWLKKLISRSAVVWDYSQKNFILSGTGMGRSGGSRQGSTPRVETKPPYN